MIKELHETKIEVQRARLLTIAEFEEFEESLPLLPNEACWWLADLDANENVAYAEGSYREEDMYAPSDCENTYLRVALDIKNGEIGNQFIFNGYVFTILSSTLAISNNVMGTAKYYDKELVDYIYEEDISCTIYAVIATILDI